MDLIVAKKDLQRLVTRAQAVADKKSTMPVLSNVLLEASEGRLTVKATDLYLSVTGSVVAEVKKPGSVAVPAKDLADRVAMMPDGPLLISTNDANASTTLKAAGSPRRYTLRGVPGQEFPQLPAPGADAVRLVLPAELMSRLIARTQFSISPDDTRPNLNSAMFEWTPGRLRMVTTDGHRLSKMEATIDGGADATAQLLLPLKAIHELRRLSDEAKRDENPTVTLIPAEPNAFFEVAGALFSVKLVDAAFPSYKKVIPEQSSKIAKLPRTAFADTLKAMNLAANDRTGGIKLALTAGVVRVTSESPESGDGLDEVPIDYSGPDMTIGFNAKYFLDVLGALEDCDEVALGLSGELDPAVIRPVNADGSLNDDYVAVVMPMRI